MTTTRRKPSKSAIITRAEAAAAAKLVRVRAAALADIALIKRRLARIREDFFDVGEALARLKKKGVAQALGHASFHLLCKARLGMSSSQADDLVEIATRISRDQALAHDRTRASALLALADATPAGVRGNTTTDEERAAAAVLERRLRRAGLEAATVRAVATKPGQPCVYRMDRLDAAGLARISAAFSEPSKRRRS